MDRLHRALALVSRTQDVAGKKGQAMNYFLDYLKRTDHRGLTKWLHYFDVYARELGHLQGRDIAFLEIGIYRGGSIPMWAGYFGKEARLTFVDIDPDCARHAEPGTNVEIGDQADPDFLAMLAEKHGPFDIIVDDGGHHVHQQITSFEHLWPHLNDRGRYIVEDTHTSYWPGFGGGYREEKSFIEYAKRLIDQMHSWYTDQDDIFPFHEMARQVEGIRFYDSVTVIEKHLKAEPPLLIGSTNGKVTGSRKSLQVRDRRSVFRGRDGT
ncbi:MAG: class I SAM-dependent methyltransferase [Rhodobacteraceae bacterium]|nr:class I SAM-dependent methyltransferase [Paracoccaceae bacterium]